MKTFSRIIIGVVFVFLAHLAGANQADNTTVTITGQTTGVTPFISKLSLRVSDTTVLNSIQFTINPKPGSVARPLSGTYSNDYLLSRGFEHPPEVILPVYGLYDGYENIVRLTYRFADGSSKQAFASITTADFDDPCGYDNPTKLKPRTNGSPFSYDYVLVKGSCSDSSPAIIDTDGALRWVGTAGIGGGSAAFFDNAVYSARGHQLFRMELDGDVTLIGDYSTLGVVNFNHNIDRGKVGILLEADTTTHFNSTNIEVDAHSGEVLKTWKLADIITAAMIAGGDDPARFVRETPADWFHGNSATYNRADDSVIVSSRENFLICLDYKTSAIKWILGDPTKKWHGFPSLKKFALTLPPGSLPPIGQHAVSVTYDQNILLFDNGQSSVFHSPRGEQRAYSSPRKYKIDLNAKTATEIWNFDLGQSLWCPYCGSVYEDSPRNYLMNFTFTDGVQTQSLAQLIGLNPADQTIFRYQYASLPGCRVAFNAIPIHLESTKFPTVGPQALNLSTRGFVSAGDNVLIGGFIVSGTEPKSMVLRALGPSLSGFGVSNALRDPVLNVYDASGNLVGSNDNWQSDMNHAVVEANGLAPANPLEAAIVRTLAPGAYTVIVTGKSATAGISLVELYDISPLSRSKLGNTSTRGSVGTGDNVLISGFIVGDVDSATIIVRALGPTLATYGVSGVLSDPTLAVYDSHGALIASNDNWQEDGNAMLVRRNGLAPPNASESALVLHLPAGAYTAVVSGANGGTGVALAEVYTLY